MTSLLNKTIITFSNKSITGLNYKAGIAPKKLINAVKNKRKKIISSLD
jgi:hypothetical protein